MLYGYLQEGDRRCLGNIAGESLQISGTDRDRQIYPCRGRGDDSFLARRPMYQEPGYEITGRRRVNPVYQEQTASPVACMRYGEECGRAGWRSVPGGESGRYGFLAGA